MRPYFDDKDAWSCFEREVRSWLGTPYRHITMVKGRGADCTLFLGACLLKAGILTELTYDYYPHDWYKHCTTERILDSLYRHFSDHAAAGVTIARLAPEAPLLQGDILALTFYSKRRISNHSAVYMGDRTIVHASPKKGVTEARTGPWLYSHITNVFRIMKESSDGI